MTITKDDPRFEQFERAFERESQRIEQIERKLPDIIEEIRKRFEGKNEKKDA